MAKRWLTIVLVFAAGIALGVAVVLANRASGKPNQAAQAAVATASQSKQLWTCGMHPQVIQDHPGDCPICHMKLTPLKTDGMTSGAGTGAVTMANGAPAPAQADGARPADQRRKIKYWWDPMMNPPYIS